jgi:DNA polymerase-4
VNSEGRAILCVDLDAFFVSVERLLRPDLRDRPVVVGGLGGRGVVAAASYEARRFGVRSAMPIGEAEKRLRGVREAIFIPPSHDLYGLHSARVRRILEEELPVVAPASIDEFYADATGLAPRHGGALAIAERLAARVFGECGLPVSIGIATSKLVAKIATDDAKPRGILRILPGREAAYLAQLPIERIPGVGPKTAPRLQAAGVREIGDVLSADAALLASVIGASGAAWLREAATGADAAPVVAGGEPRSIGHEETFDRDVATLAELEAIVTDLAERVAFRVRQEGLAARTIQLKLRYSARRKAYVEGALARDTYETVTRARTGPPTSDGLEMAARARALARQHWRAGEPLRLVGVSAQHFPASARQGLLFEAANGEPVARAERLNRTLDDLRERFGFDVIARASQRRGMP